ncbi:MAG: hypothetical protein HN725_09780 [Alphaproteobacteria bacterium]|jgi:uncharacterized protein|nr:hypothetical protein [Alphaproteobacteria bacterium]MBT4084505.1 hypothetical protein [Alphaproteobacteria bacterium]MBT4545688.1 hypothetical protein [Alphaproteobacteria bacterium]MBT7745569.1 hypothetical protein [Alphaproteobacteria bacterium]
MKSHFLTFLFGFMLTVSGQIALADTQLSEPKPSMDNPRQIVLALNTNDEAAVNNLLFNVVNIQKFYGQENVEIAVVGYGAGVRNFLKSDSKVADRIQSLILYDVQFVACGNTLDAIGRKRDELIEGVDWVQAGLPEIVERQLRGWIYLKP